MIVRPLKTALQNLKWVSVKNKFKNILTGMNL
jgi:hypothetical protein